MTRTTEKLKRDGLHGTPQGLGGASTPSGANRAPTDRDIRAMARTTMRARQAAVDKSKVTATLRRSSRHSVLSSYDKVFESRAKTRATHCCKTSGPVSARKTP